MIFSSSQLRLFPYIAILLLGFLAQSTSAKIKTSDVFNVMTDAMGFGGSCDARIAAAKADSSKPNPEDAIQQALDLCNAAIAALGKAAESGSIPKLLSSTYKQDRKRILFLAEKFWGADIHPKTLQHRSKASKDNINDAIASYKKLKDYIEGKKKDYRFACDDSWAKTVTHLQTEFNGKPKGTAITEIDSLQALDPTNPHSIMLNYAWYDKSKTEDNVPYAYFVKTKWSKNGPCEGIYEQQAKKAAKDSYVKPQAAELANQKMIYICPAVWDLDDGRLKVDLKTYTGSGGKEIDTTDESQLLGTYVTPGGVLLHEMAHHVLEGRDGGPEGGLGYGWDNCIRGQRDPANARLNPDSFLFFGIAMYLEKYSWIYGRAMKLDTMPGEDNAWRG